MFKREHPGTFSDWQIYPFTGADGKVCRMPTHFKPNVSDSSECSPRETPATAVGHFKERELARRSDLLLAENAERVARNHDKNLFHCRRRLALMSVAKMPTSVE